MIKILVADDHAVVRAGLRQIITGIPDMVIADEAGSGQEALTKILNNDYDMVLLDISMPDRSGLDILKEAKNQKPKLHILILTIHPEEQYALRVLRAGASGYLTKESAPNELITAIRKVALGGKYVSSSLAEKIAFGLEADAEKPFHQTLSDREFQVTCMIASGKTSGEIAQELLIGIKTVNTYRSRTLQKLGLRNNSELTRYVIENKLMG